MMNKEIWKDIKGYEGFYKISNTGFIKKNNVILKNYRAKGRKYYIRDLSKEGKVKRFFVHRLVLETFYPKDGYNRNKLDVNHIDGNTSNNNLSNLEWSTRSENMKHAFRIGLISHKGERHNCSKLTMNEVLSIRELLKNNYPRKLLSKIYNVKIGTIHDIALRRSWKHI